MNTDAPRATLVAIVAVDREDRVQCQAPGCGHGVYARIHVVRTERGLTVVGSDCYARLYAGATVSPMAGANGVVGGRRLTEEERRALIANTEALLERLEAEYAADERAKKEQQQAQEASRKRRVELTRSADPFWMKKREPIIKVDPLTHRLYISKAKERLRISNPGIDVDAPGWSGLVKAEARRIMQEESTRPETDD